MKFRGLAMAVVLAVVLLSLSSVPVGESDSLAGGFRMEGGTITGYDGPADVVVPVEVGGVTVTEIGSGAFSMKQIKSLTFEEGSQITRIGNEAFRQTQLEGEVVLPDTVTSIGTDAFMHSGGITKLVLGGSVSEIGDRAFYGMFKAVIELSPDNVNMKMSGGMLMNAAGTEIIYVSAPSSGDLTIPETVTSVRPYAFSLNQADSVVISKNVKVLGEYAFYSSALKSITIAPGSVLEVIGNSAFYQCMELTSVLYIPATVKTVGDSAFGRSPGVTIDVDPANTVMKVEGGMVLVEEGRKLLRPASPVVGTAVIPDCVETIDTAAFDRNDTVTGIRFGEASKVSVIGASAFNKCVNLKGDIAFPASLKDIGDLAFFMSGVQDISFPEGSMLKSIGDLAFCNTGIDGSVSLPDGLSTLGECAFQDTAIAGVSLPGGVSVYRAAFFETPSLAKVVFRGAPSHVSDSAFTPEFYDGASDTMVSSKHLNGTYVMKEDVFWKQYDVSLVFPDAVREVSVLSGDTVDPKDLEAPGDSYTVVGWERDLSRPVDTDGRIYAVTETPDGRIHAIGAVIGKGPSGSLAFLPESDIPEGERDIPDFTSYYDMSGKRVCLDIAEIPKGVFTPANLGERMTIPESVESLGPGLFADFTDIVSLDLGNRPIAVGESAFSGCTALEDIAVPGGSTIGAKAFFGCEPRTITFRGAPESLDPTAFGATFKDSNGDVPVSGLDGRYVAVDGVYVKQFRLVYSIGLGDSEIESFVDDGTVLSDHLKGWEGYEMVMGTDIAPDTVIDRDLVVTLTIGNGGSRMISGPFLYSASKDPDTDDLMLMFPVTRKPVSDIPGEISYYTMDGTKVVRKVTCIDDGAFWDHNVLSGDVTVHEGIAYIGDNAFQRSSMTSILLPSTLKEIGSGIFGGCTSLKEVRLAPGNAYFTVQDGFFSDKDREVLYFANGGLSQDVTIPDCFYTVGESAFAGYSDLKSLTFGPDSRVSFIGESAFRNCGSLEKVVFPSTLVRVEWNAFDMEFYQGPSEDDALVYDYEFAGRCFVIKDGRLTTTDKVVDKGLVYAEHGGSRYLLGYAGQGSPDLTIPKVDGAPVRILPYAFTNVPWIESVTFEEGSAEAIPESAFEYCENLKTVILSEGIAEISLDAFNGCDGIVKIVFPKTLHTVGEDAFSVDFYCKEGDDIIDCGWHDLTGRTFEMSGDRLLSTGPGYDGGLRIVVEDGRAIIMSYVGHGPSEITIPAEYNGVKVTAISNGAFADRYWLEKVTFEEGSAVESIGDFAFFNSDIGEMEFPASLRTIGKGAFEDCESLGSVRFNDGLETIGRDAFEESGLTGKIVIPASVTLIGNCAFEYCTGITSVSFAEGSLLKAIPNYTFRGDEGLSGVSLPAGLESIGVKAFYNTGLTEVVIPAGCVVKDRTFASCQHLDKVTFGGAPEVIGASSFDMVFADSVSDPVAKEDLKGVYVAVDGKFFKHHVLTYSSVFDDPVEILVMDGKSMADSLSGSESWDTVIGADIDPTQVVKGDMDVELTLGFGTGILNGRFLYMAHDGTPGLELRNCIGSDFLTSVPGEVGYFGLDGKQVVLKVTSIGEAAFAEHPVLKGDLVIPEGVVSIGDNAFAGNQSLTSVLLPSSLEKLGNNAFSGCFSLKGVSVAQGSKHFVTQEGLFSDKDRKVLYFADGVTSADLVIPDSFEVIGGGAFNGCPGIRTVTFGEGSNAAVIGEFAFWNCGSLEKVSFPSGLVKVMHKAFHIRFYEEGSDKPIGHVYDLAGRTFTKQTDRMVTGDPVVDGGFRFIDLDGKLTLLGYAGHGPADLTVPSVYGGREVEAILPGAFENNLWLEGLSFDGPISDTIPDDVFRGCTGLKTIILPEGLRTMGFDVFDGCDAVEKIYFPKTLESFEYSLMDIDFVSDTGKIDPKGHWFDLIGRTFVRGGGVMSTSDPVYDGGLKIAVEDGRATVYLYAGHGPSQVTIPAEYEGVKVTGIGPYAFNRAYWLESVVFEEGSAVETIGTRAFAGTGLTGIEFPSSVRILDSSAFYQCGSLESVVFNEGLEEIDSMVFSETGLTGGLVLPSSLTKLGLYSFESCPGITSVSFGEDSKLEKVEQSAFQNDGNLVSVELPAGLKRIGYSAFRYSGLESIVLPAGIQIDENAFRGCLKLASVTFSGEPSAVSPDSFDLPFHDGVGPVGSAEGLEGTFTASDGDGFLYRNYRVTLDLGNGTDGMTVQGGKPMPVPSTPERSGYVFAGWMSDGRTYDFSQNVTSDMTLTATWSVYVPEVEPVEPVEPEEPYEPIIGGETQTETKKNTDGSVTTVTNTTGRTEDGSSVTVGTETTKAEDGTVTEVRKETRSDIYGGSTVTETTTVVDPDGVRTVDSVKTSTSQGVQTREETTVEVGPDGKRTENMTSVITKGDRLLGKTVACEVTEIGPDGKENVTATIEEWDGDGNPTGKFVFDAVITEKDGTKVEEIVRTESDGKGNPVSRAEITTTTEKDGTRTSVERNVFTDGDVMETETVESVDSAGREVFDEKGSVSKADGTVTKTFVQHKERSFVRDSQGIRVSQTSVENRVLTVNDADGKPKSVSDVKLTETFTASGYEADFTETSSYPDGETYAKRTTHTESEIDGKGEFVASDTFSVLEMYSGGKVSKRTETSKVFEGGVDTAVSVTEKDGLRTGSQRSRVLTEGTGLTADMVDKAAELAGKAAAAVGGIPEGTGSALLAEARGTSMELHSDATDRLSSGNTVLGICLDSGTVTIGSDVCGTLSKAGNTVLSMEMDDSSSLNDAQKAAVGDNRFLVIGALSGGKDVHELGGDAKVVFGYEPAEGTDTSSLRVYYVDGDGSLVPMEAVYLDGAIEMVTDHFSVFVVTDEPLLSGGDEGGSAVYLVVAAIAVVLVAVAAVVLLRRRN